MATANTAVKKVTTNRTSRAKLKLLPSPPKADLGAIEALRKKLDCKIATKAAAVQDACNVYSGGSLAFDLGTDRVDPIFGNGGLPERSIAELFGPPGTGKSLTLYHLIKSVQQRGLIFVLLATEEPDFDNMRRVGVDVDALLVIDCYDRGSREAKYMTAEKRLGDLITACKDARVGGIGIDALKSLTSSSQIFSKGDSSKAADRPFEETEVAIRAQLMEKFFNRFKAHNRRAFLVIVNHVSESPPSRDDRYKRLPGDEDRPKTPGGRRMEYECMYRVQVIGKSRKTKEEHEILPCKLEIGMDIYYKFWKNKRNTYSGKPKLVVPFIWADQCFSKWSEVVLYGVYLGLITRKGNGYYYRDKHYRSKALLESFFKKCPNARAKLERKIVKLAWKIFEIKGKGKKKTVIEKLSTPFTDANMESLFRQDANDGDGDFTGEEDD